VPGDPLLELRGDAPLLVEADGARQRSLKAPADHEPALPDQFEPLTVVPVAALDVLGQRIDSPLVHRPERVAALLGVDQSPVLGPAEIAAVLGSEDGGLKGVPIGAELRVLLTKVTPERMAAAREIADLLMQNRRIDSVSVADLAADDPVLETHSRVAGIVLAAGGSSRLGEPKQLVHWRGQPLVWHAVRAALDGGLSPVVVVVGQAAERVRQALAGEPVAFIENLDWQAGQSRSVLAGMEALADLRLVEAVVMLLADMPFVDAQLVRAVGDRYRKTGAALVAPYADGRRSNPVLFDRVTFDDLQRLEGDQGGRVLFERYPHQAIEWDDSITFDLDTPEDFKRLRELE
jgi:molybdenum cofactor cytidylyltransferase